MVLETISSLKVPAKIRSYRKSDVIFEEGSTDLEMYIIYSGRVRLSTKEPGREITLAVIGPGEFFGEVAVIDSAFRTATAIADEDDTRLVVLDQKKFREIVNEHPAFALTIMQHLAIASSNLTHTEIKVANLIPHQGRQDDEGNRRPAEPLALHGGFPPQQHPRQARPEEQERKPEDLPAEPLEGGVIKKGGRVRGSGSRKNPPHSPFRKGG
ncbi:MAG: cyclic nucleotide-binding domain-containing protein [Syntrophobacterales bacterium]|nr:cyclic nucleotide-binding domain-containing protein [Syntrophobacterales bacterium]